MNKQDVKKDVKNTENKIRVSSWDEFKQEQKEKKIKNFSKVAKEEPLYKKKEDSINYSIKDGLYSSVKGGLTESFVMPFAIALSASTGMLAALSSIPDLLASFFQLFSQASLKFFKTRSKLIVWTAFIQSLMWLPLLFIPLVAGSNITLALTLLLIFITLEKIFGTFQGPILNSMLGDIIDDDKRGEFFGKRNRIVNLMGFISTFLAGLLLTFFKQFDSGNNAHYIFFGFGILFFLAFIFRAIASYYKSKIYDSPYTPQKNNITFFNFMKNMTHNNYGIFVLYIFMFKLVAFISAPFFALYLLRDLGISYIYFTLILGASIMASFITMGMWGKIIDKHGSKLVLTISAFLTPLTALLLVFAMFIKDPLWLFIFLLLEEAFSGFVWAGFNLSTSSFLFDSTSKEERVKYIAYYNFLTGIAVFLGAMLGGVLIRFYPRWTIVSTALVSAIPVIYVTTGVLRLLITSIFIKKVRESRMVEIDFPGRGFFHRVLTVNPHSHNHVEILSSYEGPQQAHFHSLLFVKNNIKPVKNITSHKMTEKELYEKKSFEYYRQNAMKTMNQKDKPVTPKDDSDKIAKNIEQDKKSITELTEKIKNEHIKKK
jgi:MFS family permease